MSPNRVIARGPIVRFGALLAGSLSVSGCGGSEAAADASAGGQPSTGPLTAGEADASSGGGSMAVVAGSPSAGLAPPSAPAEVCDAYTQVFVQSCNGQICHDNPIRPEPFSVDAQAALAFVGVPSRNADYTPEACGLMIDPVNPGESLLLRKVNGTLPKDGSCGLPMPLNGDAVSPAQIACLENWLGQFSP